MTDVLLALILTAIVAPHYEPTPTIRTMGATALLIIGWLGLLVQTVHTIGQAAP